MDQNASGGRDGRGRGERHGVLEFVFQRRRWERHAVHRFGVGGRHGRVRRPEDREYQRRDRGHHAQGFTLYSFAPDTATTSKCTGTCAQIWPPVNAPATAGPGVTGQLGTITRAGGSKQATYDGHPLYTYTADTAPGQAKGNGVNVDGGVWHEVTASGAAAPAGSSGGTGGGNGY